LVSWARVNACCAAGVSSILSATAFFSGTSSSGLFRFSLTWLMLLGIRMLVDGAVPSLFPSANGLDSVCSEEGENVPEAAASCFNLLFFLGLQASPEQRLPD